jgi:ParB family transcriptional regulator, chromosome partitioning protein
VAQKPALGKGLASLFPHLPAAGPAASPPPVAGAVSAGPALPATGAESMNRDRHPGISLATTDDIQVNQYQPRREFNEAAIEELAQSIRANGIIQPLIVRKDARGGYQLIAGERRLRAAKLAGLKQVPIVIRRTTDREALELALIENIQRQDLGCVDEALAYHQLIQDFSLTQEEVAQRVGKDRATVANHLRLLRLPQAILDDLKTGNLTFGHAKALLSLEDNDLRLKVRLEILDGRWSVRQTEAHVERLKAQASGASTPSPAPKSPIVSRMATLAQELTRKWSARVEIRGNDRRGKILLHYSTRQELDRILEAMQNHRA